MDTRSGLLRYGLVALAWIAGIEWLLGRVVSRLAASPALDGTPRTAIELLGSVGLFLLAPATLLALSMMLLSVSSLGADALLASDRWRLAAALYLGLFTVVSIAYILLPRASWLAIAYTLMALLAFWLCAVTRPAKSPSPPALRVGVLLVAFAYTGFLLNLLVQYVGSASLVTGMSPIIIRDIGEAFLVAVPILFFAALAVPFGQWLKPARWVVPLLLALAFSAANIADMLADQGFTGVLAIWSIGLSYYLPWPLYAVCLALYAYTILTCFTDDDNKLPFATRDRGIGLLMLTFASYELQFPYQYILALLSLMLLSGIITPVTAAKLGTTRLAADKDSPPLSRLAECVPQGQADPPIITT